MADTPKACPACGGGHVIRPGRACGRQRWRCKGYGRQFTRTTPCGKPQAVKDKAISLYCTGLSLNATGKRLGVSVQSVMRSVEPRGRRMRHAGSTWVRDHAYTRCPKLAPTGGAAVVEIDEVWRFVQKKPASSGSGRCSSATVAG